MTEEMKLKAEELYPKPKPKLIPDDYYNAEFTDRYMEAELLQAAFINGYSLAEKEIADRDKEIERLKVLSETMGKYITFLDQESSKFVQFAATHGLGVSAEVYNIGKAYRDQIQKLKSS